MKIYAFITVLLSYSHICCNAATARFDLLDGYEIRDVDIDPSGNIWVCGTAYKTMAAASGGSWGNTVAFVQKATSSGLSGNTVFMPLDNRRAEQCNGITVKDNTNIFITGSAVYTGRVDDFFVGKYSGAGASMTRILDDYAVPVANANDIATVGTSLFLCGEAYGSVNGKVYSGSGTADLYLAAVSFAGAVTDDYMAGSGPVNDRCTHVLEYNSGAIYVSARSSMTRVATVTVANGLLTPAIRADPNIGDNMANAFEIDSSMTSTPDLFISGSTNGRNYDILSYVKGTVSTNINVAVPGASLVSVVALKLIGTKLYAAVIVNYDLYLFRYSRDTNALTFIDSKDLQVIGATGASLVQKDANTLIIAASTNSTYKFSSTIIVFDLVSEYALPSSTRVSSTSTSTLTSTSTSRSVSVTSSRASSLSTRIPSSSPIVAESSLLSTPSQSSGFFNHSPRTTPSMSSALSAESLVFGSASASRSTSTETTMSSNYPSSVYYSSSLETVVNAQSTPIVTMKNRSSSSISGSQQSGLIESSNLEGQVREILTVGLPAAAAVIGCISMVVIFKSISRMRARTATSGNSA